MSTNKLGSIPVAMTTFIGRAREVATLRQLLRAVRLLTLTGAGGSGKTRLAAEVASYLEGEYPDGVAWVELAPLAEPTLLTGHVADALGVRHDAARATIGTLADALRGRSMLLVLDNCEHVVDACAQLVDALLRECPGLRVLATSREALGLGGERAWLVPPLPVPTRAEAAAAAALADVEAVQLFVERAQSALASFELGDRNAAAVAQICCRLEGLPLAIELAAARVRVLTPEQIAQRLEDSFQVLSTRIRGVPTRHQTLYSTVDWSYQLLSHPERLLLARLSVFAGGFTLSAMEAICGGDGIDATDMLDLLAELVDKSLVVMHEEAGTARYAMLEVVRQFARSRLEADPAAAEALRRRHADYFASLAESALPHLRRSSAPAWMARLAADQDNLRVAVSSSLAAAGAAHTAMRMASALWWFWGQRGQYGEGLAWLEGALHHPEAQAATPERAHALAGAGAFAVFYGESQRARTLFQQSVELWEQVGADTPERAHTLSTFAYLLADLHEHDAALRYGHDAARRARELGIPWLIAMALLNGLAHAYYQSGELDLADRACADARTAAEAEGFAWGVVEAELRQALIALRRDDVADAAVHARRAAESCRGGGSETFTAFRVRAVLVCAAVAVQQGRMEQAARLFGATAAMRDSMGSLMLPYGQEAYEGYLADLRHSLGDDRFARAWTEGKAMALQPLLELAVGASGAAETAARADGPAPVLVDRTPGASVLDTRAHGAVRPAAVPPAFAAPTPDRQAPELQVLALGPLRIMRAGEPLPTDAWAYAKPRELLLYLLCHPDGRSREQIGVVFWPEATAAQLRNNFHVTLHHIRKALGRSDVITFEHERYRLNYALGIEFDAQLFEAEIRAALRVAREADGIEQLRAALSRYRGDFLEDLAVGDWHFEHRDHLRRLYLDGMLALGERLTERAADAEAARTYQQVVLREPLHEEACRRLMVALARTGERAQAMRQYERLATLLRVDLEAEPEPETRALFERLRRGVDLNAG